MANLWRSFLEWFADERALAFGRGLLVLVVGLFLARMASLAVGRAMSKRFGAQHIMIAQRSTRYGVTVLVLISALRHVGFDLGVLVGAAGLLTVAIGFASQTSASNLISGIFLMGEQPFVIGDVIRVGGTTGEVIAMDLLSVKLRTFDNLFVRLPNETLLKSEITNLTRFPIRRLDLQIGVAYKEDLTRVREVLDAVADRNPVCLDEPAPLFIFQGFADSALTFQFSVWAARENFLDLRNSIYLEIKQAFDQANIEFPFPHRTLYTGAVTTPFPIRLVSGADAAPTDAAPTEETEATGGA